MSGTLCPSTPTYSIHSEAEREAAIYKWIESERAGRNLGDEAICRWVQHHWWGYLRARWIEHLEGKRFWIELKREDFGLLKSSFDHLKPLSDEILELVKLGKENLCIINWAIDKNYPIEPVFEILTVIDINGRRMSCRFG
jgi:hypothetical protein